MFPFSFTFMLIESTSLWSPCKHYFLLNIKDYKNKLLQVLPVNFVLTRGAGGVFCSVWVCLFGYFYQKMEHFSFGSAATVDGICTRFDFHQHSWGVVVFRLRKVNSRMAALSLWVMFSLANVFSIPSALLCHSPLYPNPALPHAGIWSFCFSANAEQTNSVIHHAPKKPRTEYKKTYCFGFRSATVVVVPNRHYVILITGKFLYRSFPFEWALSQHLWVMYVTW